MLQAPNTIYKNVRNFSNLYKYYDGNATDDY